MLFPRQGVNIIYICKTNQYSSLLQRQEPISHSLRQNKTYELLFEENVMPTVRRLCYDPFYKQLQEGARLNWGQNHIDLFANTGARA